VEGGLLQIGHLDTWSRGDPGENLGLGPILGATDFALVDEGARPALILEGAFGERGDQVEVVFMHS
jgi:hypothetical protein